MYMFRDIAFEVRNTSNCTLYQSLIIKGIILFWWSCASGCIIFARSPGHIRVYTKLLSKLMVVLVSHRI